MNREKKELQIIVIIIISMLFNPFISLLINIYIYIRKDIKITKILLILNCGILNYFKIPETGDYVSYLTLFYTIKDYTFENLQSFLIYKKDFLFYYVIYFFKIIKLEYSEWAFFQSAITYIFILKTIDFLPNKNGKFKYIYFFIYNPFFISRNYLAMAMSIYGLIYIQKKNKLGLIPIYLSIITHISLIVLPIYYFILKRIINKISKISDILNKPIILVIFSGVVGKIISYFSISLFIKFHISSSYYSGDFVFLSKSFFGKIISLITNYLFFIIPILLSYGTRKKKIKNIIGVSIIIIFILLGISPIIARRIVILLVGLLLCLVQNYSVSKKVKLIIMGIFILVNIFPIKNYILSSFKTESYPFKFNRITKQYIYKNYYIDKENRKLIKIN